jgi:phosphohistidine swiveling domain-containing protein
VSGVRLVPLPVPAGPGCEGRGAVLSPAEAGFKGHRLACALRAGLPALPGFVVPVSASREVLQAGAAAVRDLGRSAGRVAVLGLPVDPELDAELRDVVDGLGGRVIVRSSSPLESDLVWAGAFSSVTGVRREDAGNAVRSCWASAFAPDPLRRLEGCGLGLDALELAVLLQPEIVPEAGGVAHVTADRGAGVEVSVAGVAGHPGALLSGWAEGARDADLASLIGPQTVADVAGLARRVYAMLGDDAIEWGACQGKVWLLQSQRSGSRAGPAAREASLPRLATCAGDGLPGLAALVVEHGKAVPANPVSPGTATGPLQAAGPHQAVACRDAILLVERPLPALAPLLFGARGVICRAAAAGSHLAEVARSLGVPMVTGCHAEAVTGPDPSGWFATVNGTTGEVFLLADGISRARG